MTLKPDEDDVEIELQPYYDESEIRRAVALLCDPAGVHELRALGVPGAGTVSGYYDADAYGEFRNDLTNLSGDAEGVYFTLNSVNPELQARSFNRIRNYAKHTTADSDVVRRRFLPLDFDPVRPSGISSTNTEHDAAIAKARDVFEFLLTLGFDRESLVLGDSGNGAHLLCRVELPNDTAGRDLVKACIDATDAKFSDSRVQVDRTTFNAARIWKMPGTMACKGDSIEARPHRIAKLLIAPERCRSAHGPCLRRLAELAPPPASRPSTPKLRTHGKPFDLERWLERNNVPVGPPKPWEGGRLWTLATCPWKPEHTNGSAFVGQAASGALFARCHHNSCQGNSWHELRDVFEPGWRD